MCLLKEVAQISGIESQGRVLGAIQAVYVHQMSQSITATARSHPRVPRLRGN